jgi:NHLM bacteriocin system ABC transporter ATP-binding protein
MSNSFARDEFDAAMPILGLGQRRLAIDPRRPLLLSDRAEVLQVVAGYVDIFAVEASGTRHYLFRVATGEIVLDLDTACEQFSGRLHIVAIGGPQAELVAVSRTGMKCSEELCKWIGRLSELTDGKWAGSNSGPESIGDRAVELQAGERCCGPKRGVVWAQIEAGSANPLGLDLSLSPASPPLPLTARFGLEARDHGCKMTISGRAPATPLLWLGIDHYHEAIAVIVEQSIGRDLLLERQRLTRRAELTHARTRHTLEELSGVISRRAEQAKIEPDTVADPLHASCQIIMGSLGATITPIRRSDPANNTFADVLEIARASQFRVRRVELRDLWWKCDVGPLLVWHGQDRRPVALIRDRGQYAAVDAASGTRHDVTASMAGEFAPDAISFYAALPARPLRYRDLLFFAAKESVNSVSRVALAIIAIGLLSLIAPLTTNVLVSSVIPRTEIDQLVVCAAVLAVTAIAMGCLQGMQGLITLRLEGLLDYRLQAALIDRLLRLPASFFRNYTTGDLVNRSLGIEAARQIFTGRVLGGFSAALFGLFSVGLVIYYDMKLGLVALLLVIVRAAVILITGLVRIHYEGKHLNLQGKIGGFVLQLIAGVSKLRVANAADRALARWAGEFAVQKRYFLASQRVGNVLVAFEMTFPTVATLVIFALAAHAGSRLMTDLGAFLGFFAAFGQSTAAFGSLASSVSESLVAIPNLTRLQPIISTGAEIVEDRGTSTALTGEVELSGVTFRYVADGPKILDDLTLRVPSGEYVAIVGPSGSGKSSLLRLLLGFERPEAGTIFYDGKALNTLDVSAVRRQLGVVLQDTKLATGTLYDNICGGVQLTVDKAMEAARLAALDVDIAQMPMGMHTLAAEGISTLSGGQRQRVLIARALARAPRLLFFDEATSALDNQTQAIVAKTLGRLGVTRIVIAHRLSTIRDADRIVMMVDGRIVQSGGYTELMEAGGPFADFAQRQLLS